MEQIKPKKSLKSRIARILIKTFLFIFLFILLVLVLILLPPVQNFIKNKAVTYLENKLHTKVKIGKIYVSFPKKIVINDFFIADRNHDTLASGASLKVDLALWKLIFHGQTEIDNIELTNSTVRITRNEPDTFFNYQFIIDAFNPPSSPVIKDTASQANTISIKKIRLDKIRLVFKDGMTGNDAEAALDHLDIKMDKLDPEKMTYAIPGISIDGLTASVYQYKPFSVSPSPAPIPVNPNDPVAPSIQLILDKIGLKQVYIDYRNDVSAITGSIRISKADGQVNSLDLDKQFLHLTNLSLENSAIAIRMGMQPLTETRQNSLQDESTAGWRLELNALRLDNDSIQYDDDNLPRQPAGMDYAHIKAGLSTLHMDDFLLSPDSVRGTITKASLAEQGGFLLKELETSFYYGNTGGYLKDLHLLTAGTELQKDVMVMYPSLAAAMNNPGIIEINAHIDHSRISSKDILAFAPELRKQPAFANPDAVWRLNGNINGRLDKLDIQKLQFNGLSGTNIDINGTIAGLPDPKKINANLHINQFASNRNDLNLFLPAGSIPAGFTLPTQWSASGNINGDINGMHTDLSLQSNLGDASISGLFKNYTDLKRISYDANIESKTLKLGVILQQPQTIGDLSAAFRFTGSGMDPKTMNAIIDGKISSISLNGYDYRDLAAKGRIANESGNFEASIIDPNIHIGIKGTADFSGEFPGLEIHAIVDSLKAQALHLTPNLVIYRGNIDANIPVANPDKPTGTILFTNTLLVNDDKRVELDSMEIVATTDGNHNSIKLISSVGNAEINGVYALDDLGDILQNTINPYFALQPTGAAIKNSRPYDFNLNARIVNSPLLAVFLPDLKKTEPIQFNSHFSNDSGWNADLNAPYIEINGMTIRDWIVNAKADPKKIDWKTSIGQMDGGGFGLLNTTLTGTVANNQIDFLFNSKDGSGKDKYNMGAILVQATPGDYKLSLKPEGLLLNYEPWTISADNQLSLKANDINARHFILEKEGQFISLVSQSSGTNAPLEAGFSNFKLSTLTGFIQEGAPVADGTLNGKLVFTGLSSHPVFTGDLTITDLAIQKDTVGNLKVLMNNKALNNYFADMTLSGRGNNVHLTGNYYPENGNGNQFDFITNIEALPLANAQAFSMGNIKEATGLVKGEFTLKGNLNRPLISGDLVFDKAGFNLSMLNSYYTIDQENIKVSEEGFLFNDFSLKDSAGNTLSVNGTAATHNFRNYQFDMTLKAQNFRALNSTKKDNRYFYGQLYFNTNMRISGTEAAPVVDGRLTVNDKTKITVVLPQEEPGVVDREGVVEFVDRSAGINDSLFSTPLDSLNTIGFTGMDISMNLQLDKEADITLVIDEGNGDFLNLKGEASITADIDRTGKIFMSGSYELDQGSYEISFNLLRRKFSIQKGSKISWEGEPTKAKVDITAIYAVSTSPLDLVKSELSEGISTTERNTYLQKLPFEVTLKMTGDLMKPLISFDIKLPENKSFQVSNDIITNVKTRLDQLRNDEGEMNKQVFSLLLLNRFVAENPFASSGSTPVSILAKQSVSRLLTEQLNRLATDLIKGVELNFDVQASEDYTTGSRQDRTDLNVGVSKKLMNDRLTVSVGSNFELEGPQNSNQQSNNIAGNVAVDYKLSKDGRYLLRAYRKNEYQGVIDGYVIETGVGFIITVDYNKFRELFHSRRSHRRPTDKQENNEQQKNQTIPEGEKPPVKQ